MNNAALCCATSADLAVAKELGSGRACKRSHCSSDGGHQPEPQESEVVGQRTIWRRTRQRTTPPVTPLQTHGARQQPGQRPGRLARARDHPGVETFSILRLLIRWVGVRSSFGHERREGTHEHVCYYSVSPARYDGRPPCGCGHSWLAVPDGPRLYRAAPRFTRQFRPGILSASTGESYGCSA